MKKQHALVIWSLAGITCLGAALLAVAGYMEAWIAQILLVVAFPAFIIFIALWWSASKEEGDIPFVGY